MEISTKELLDRANDQLTNNLPLVIYKLPRSSQLNAVLQQHKNLEILKNFKAAGFVFSPFNSSAPAVIFKEASCIHLKAKLDNLTSHENQFFTEVEMEQFSEIQRDQHINLVKKGKSFLEETPANKVVLSRKLAVPFKHLNKILTFKNMLATYPEAMVYLWYHPKIGCWMGASPETFVQLHGSYFETMSLAGTRPYLGAVNTTWSLKEIQEQQYVTSFLLENLKGLVEAIEVLPKQTLRAGNLIHICNKIKGRVKDASVLEGIIKKIHPTPAVCGLPQNSAKAFIETNESYNRNYYTGYLGEINLKGASNLFVNLRCMEVEDKQIYIYVGGGITLDSKAEDEFKETVDKSKVMLKTLR